MTLYDAYGIGAHGTARPQVSPCQLRETAWSVCTWRKTATAASGISCQSPDAGNRPNGRSGLYSSCILLLRRPMPVGNPPCAAACCGSACCCLPGLPPVSRNDLQRPVTHRPSSIPSVPLLFFLLGRLFPRPCGAASRPVHSGSCLCASKRTSRCSARQQVSSVPVGGQEANRALSL